MNCAIKFLVTIIKVELWLIRRVLYDFKSNICCSMTDNVFHALLLMINCLLLFTHTHTHKIWREKNITSTQNKTKQKRSNQHCIQIVSCILQFNTLTTTCHRGNKILFRQIIICSFWKIVEWNDNFMSSKTAYMLWKKLAIVFHL